MVGSFMFDFDTATMSKCLKVPSEKFRDKLKSDARRLHDDHEEGTCRAAVARHGARRVVPEALRRRAGRHARWRTSRAKPNLPPSSCAEKELSDPDWTFRRGRKLVESGVKISADTPSDRKHLHKARGGLIRVHLLGA
jgi:lipoate---protein ligase